MPVNYDPEFFKALEPLIPILSSTPKPAVHDVESRRNMLLAMFTQLLPVPDEPKDMEYSVHEIKSYDGATVAVHRFLPKAAQSASGPTSAVLHIHGGGLIAGSVDGFKVPIAVQADNYGVQHFSVNYRKAPENPAPAGLEDCYAALVWLSKNASSFNVDPKRIVVFGESAGGNLALGTSLLARDRALSPPIAKQVLIYPMLDDKNVTPDPELEPFLIWNTADNVTGWTAYLGDKYGTDDVNPYYAPGRCENLAGLPSTYIDIGTLDLFLDENLKLASKLAASKVEMELHVYPGVPHAFTAFAPDAHVVKMANVNRVRATTTV